MNNKYLLLCISIIFSISLSACTAQETRSTSSIVDYLYSTNKETVIKPSIPVLNLPLKIGIAFVPDYDITREGNNFWASANNGGVTLTSNNKLELLENVAEKFHPST